MGASIELPPLTVADDSLPPTYNYAVRYSTVAEFQKTMLIVLSFQGLVKDF